MTRAIAIQILLVFGLAVGQANGAAAPQGSPTPRQRMAKALNTFIPEIHFREASLPDIVNFLSKEAGVNIIIDPSVYAFAATPGEAASSGGELPSATSGTAAVKPEPGEAGREERSSGEVGGITLHLKNVPLKVVLKYILRYKNLRYIVEDYAIVIVPIGRALPEELRIEVFRLTTGSYPGAGATLR